MQYPSVTRKEDGTINVLFPDPEEEDLVAYDDTKAVLADEYIEEDYYEAVEHVTQHLDNDSIIFFGHASKAAKRLEDDADPEELEEFVKRLATAILDFEEINIEVE